MSTLFLLRHGQAGPRHDYDQLSPLGHTQTLLLGSHLASLNLPFHAALTGSLHRQQLSAANALSRFSSPPPLLTDPRWNEFDFFHLYDEIAPKMSFAKNATQDDRDHAVLKAWLFGQHNYSGESWSQFSARVKAALLDAQQSLASGPILVFTSAAPTAVALGHALSLNPFRINSIAGSLYHTAISAISLQKGRWSLTHENLVPHLEPHLQTTR